MQTILVTGATGFVGRAVTRRLIASGTPVRAMVRDQAKAATCLDRRVTLYQGSVLDPNAIASAADGADVIVHAAAASLRATNEELKWVNVAGTENTLRAAAHVGTSRVVLISCADVTLVDRDRVHWNEERPMLDSPYDEHAATKRLAEEIALANSNNDLDVVALRPSFLWGPGETHALPRLCREALDGGIQLFGDGKTLFSSTYIENLVDAVMAAASSPNAAGNAYYVTDADFLDAGEFFSMLSKALGTPPPRRGWFRAAAMARAHWHKRLGATGLWPTDVVRRTRSSHFDVQRAVRDLDYRAACTVEQGMVELERWVRDQGGAEAIAKRGAGQTTTPSSKPTSQRASGA